MYMLTKRATSVVLRKKTFAIRPNLTPSKSRLRADYTFLPLILCLSFFSNFCDEHRKRHTIDRSA